MQMTWANTQADVLIVYLATSSSRQGVAKILLLEPSWRDEQRTQAPIYSLPNNSLPARN